MKKNKNLKAKKNEESKEFNMWKLMKIKLIFRISKMKKFNRIAKI